MPLQVQFQQLQALQQQQLQKQLLTQQLLMQQQVQRACSRRPCSFSHLCSNALLRLSLIFACMEVQLMRGCMKVWLRQCVAHCCKVCLVIGFDPRPYP